MSSTKSQQTKAMMASGPAEHFKQFDIATDFSDHYYAVATPNAKKPKEETDSFSNAADAVKKKIMKEWRDLEANLPESIYVRAYEGRIDLLRAVIIGAAATPYHDGLFFFDLSFPSNYPSAPPKVHYRSRGLRINPNYDSGFVCLSLLNTWNGLKTEKWDPNSSRILQVLLSIQALVLNEEPYFNEPAFEMRKQEPQYQKVSFAYNEKVFVLSCRTMAYLLRNPPKNFERFVADHFRMRGRTILMACTAYRKGRVKVGYYRDGSSASSSTRIEVSSKFKTDMRIQYKRLKRSFAKLNTDEKSRIQNAHKLDDAGKEKPKLGILQKLVEWLLK